MALNIYIVYKQTLDAVESDKIEAAEEILKKTRQTINLTLKSIEEGTYKIVSQNGIKKSIEDFEKLEPSYQEKILDFTERKLGEVKEINPYIDQFLCITAGGSIISYGGELDVDLDSFYNSELYKDLTTGDQDIIWLYKKALPIFTNSKNDKIFIVANRIESIFDQEKVVGYLLTFVNKENFKTLHNDISFETTGKINVYDDLRTPVLSDTNYWIEDEYHSLLLENRDFYKMERTLIGDKEFYFGIAPLNPKGWYIEGIVPRKELTDSVRNNLRKSLWSIAFITIILGLWIIIEIIILSRVITEKEMAHYRLVVSEKMNEKLRMYKHDMLNHFQIVRGLIELEYPKRAVEYIMNVANEGMDIRDKYEIGIPEIESTIFTATSKARERDIDVDIDCIKLPEKLPIPIYDLTKTLTNLIKNAIYALENTHKEPKRLKIRIYEDLDDYVFEVVNSVPIIPEEIREKIFNKGFTTKGEDGNGLGLYIVNKIANKNNGDMKLIVDDEGNHFIIRFPRNL